MSSFSFKISQVRRVVLALCVGAWCVAGAPSAHANSRYLVKQASNSDCGPAALATLLRYYLDVPTNEAEITRLAYSNQNGTTLVGLEAAAGAKGAGADSFRMNEATLRQQLDSYPVPLLVRLLLPEAHFVLVLGMTKDTVLIADPSSGNLMMPLRSFLRRWIIEGSNEGYVLIAARTDGHTNVAHRDEIVNELWRGQQVMRAQRLAPTMRR